jgi:hypothetical protein
MLQYLAGRVGGRPWGLVDADFAAFLEATMATPWLTGVGAVGHVRILQKREIAIGFVKE